MIARDKILHAVVGLVIGAAAGAGMGVVVGVGPGIAAGICLATMAGVGKEVYDREKGGTPDQLDAWATIGGGVIGAVLGALVAL